MKTHEQLAKPAPRRPNGFQDRMRRDPTFVAMLEALKRVLRDATYEAEHIRPSTVGEVRAVIAKATRKGRS